MRGLIVLPKITLRPAATAGSQFADKPHGIRQNRQNDDGSDQEGSYKSERDHEHYVGSGNDDDNAHCIIQPIHVAYSTTFVTGLRR